MVCFQFVRKLKLSSICVIFLPQIHNFKYTRRTIIIKRRSPVAQIHQDLFVIPQPLLLINHQLFCRFSSNEKRFFSNLSIDHKEMHNQIVLISKIRSEVHSDQWPTRKMRKIKMQDYSLNGGGLTQRPITSRWSIKLAFTMFGLSWDERLY